MHVSVTVVGLMLSCVLCGPEKPKPAPKDAPIPREDYRYDGKSFEQWRRQLLTELKPEKRLEALMAVRAFVTKGYAAEAAAATIDIMMDYSSDTEIDRDIDRAATDIIDEAGVSAQRALLRALKGHNRNQRLFVLEWFSHSHQEQVSLAFALAVIGELTLDRDAEEVRGRAIDVLLGCFNDKEVKPILVKALKDGNVEVRSTALGHILCHCNWRAGDPILELALRGLRDREEAVRLAAVEGFRARGQDLLGKLGDRHRETVLSVLRPVVEGWKGVPGLITLMKDPSPKVRLQAVQAFAHFIPFGEASITTALKAALKDSDPAVRKEAAEAISKAVPAAPKPLPQGNEPTKFLPPP